MNSSAPLHPCRDDGSTLDATFELSSIQLYEVVYHHKAGARDSPRSVNADYHEGLELLLQRLASVSANDPGSERRFKRCPRARSRRPRTRASISDRPRPQQRHARPEARNHPRPEANCATGWGQAEGRKRPKAHSFDGHHQATHGLCCRGPPVGRLTTGHGLAAQVASGR